MNNHEIFEYLYKQGVYTKAIVKNNVFYIGIYKDGVMVKLINKPLEPYGYKQKGKCKVSDALTKTDRYVYDNLLSGKLKL